MTRPPFDTSDPLVSIVIPAHNASAYVGEAVRSVLSQTVENIEVIVVDDGSVDGTAEVLEGIRDPRLRVIRQPNRGASAARNAGLSAMGPSRFVAFLDADDRWDPRKLEMQIRYMDENPDCVIVGSMMHYISSTGRVLGRTGQTVAPEEQERVRRGELFPFPLSSFLVRREVLDRVGGFEEELGCPSGGPEDIDLIARLAEHGLVGCVPSILGSYRMHPASAMATNRRGINRAARFVRRRLAARRNGGDLTWDEFISNYRQSWDEWRQDTVQVYYRQAALWYGERKPLRALACGLVALALGPVYTIRRVSVQRFGVAALRGGQETAG